ncbi:MAG: CRISPR-associated protein Cas4 [Deltaproteobacteria bacterium]|nr:CRISPR-associated protein Cas4 [Deltaproteobacteria bacterium]
MPFSDSELLPISALQHFIYCPRQCALIYLEQQWAENRFTAEGRVQHDRVDRTECEIRDGIRYEYALSLRSLELGLIGKADVVEFHDDNVFPVEHKRGRPKPTHCDWVQLCAQALCLEEMMGVKVDAGAIFYGKPRRRQVVEFTPELRAETINSAHALHELIEFGKNPPADYSPKKCDACSLFDICLPQKKRNVSDYIKGVFS